MPWPARVGDRAKGEKPPFLWTVSVYLVTSLLHQTKHSMRAGVHLLPGVLSKHCSLRSEQMEHLSSEGFGGGCWGSGAMNQCL